MRTSGSDIGSGYLLEKEGYNRRTGAARREKSIRTANADGKENRKWTEKTRGELRAGHRRKMKSGAERNDGRKAGRIAGAAGVPRQAGREGKVQREEAEQSREPLRHRIIRNGRRSALRSTSYLL